MAAITEYCIRLILWIITISSVLFSQSSADFTGWEDYITSWEDQPQSKTLFPYGGEYYDMSVPYNSGGLDMQLDYEIPFYGRIYQNAYLDTDGHIEWTNQRPARPTPKHPMTEWPADYPDVADPPFLAPYLASFVDTGLPDDPGKVYWRRLDPDSETLPHRKEIAEGMLGHLSGVVHGQVLGTGGFAGEYGLVATWSQMTYNGCYDASCPRNTVQAALVTDGTYTYVVHNYQELGWVGGVPQGYSPEDGVTCPDSCRPAQAGFNAGSAEGFHPLPHSNTDDIRSLVGIGRLVYGVHSLIIQRGGCTNLTSVDPVDWPLMLEPSHGSMLGGQAVYVSGPCFHPDLTPTVHCRFGSVVVQGSLLDGDQTRALCVTPYVTFIGHVEVRLSIDNMLSWPYSGTFFYEIPNLGTPTLHLDHPEQWFGLDADTLAFHWDPMDLESVTSPSDNTTDPLPQHSVDVRLHAYTEWENNNKSVSELVEIRIMEQEIDNTGQYTFLVPEQACQSAEECDWGVPLPVGLMEVRQTGSGSNPRRLWSQPFPLGWYARQVWELHQGPQWADDRCRAWLDKEEQDTSWINDLEVCPMSKAHAQTDIGHFVPGWQCDITSPVWPLCPRYPMPGSLEKDVLCYNQLTPRSTKWPATSHCCYDKDGDLLYAGDSERPENSSPSAKAATHGHTQASHGGVPMLSHFAWDTNLQVLCCNWTTQPSICQSDYMRLRPTPDISRYDPPKITSTYGDPHFLTYDGVEYTFNGRGEYWLLQVYDMPASLDNIVLQARLEKPKNETWGDIRATVMTVVAMQEGYADDMSVPTIEIAMMTPPSTTDLMVLVNSDPYDLTSEYSRYLEIPYLSLQDNTRKIIILNNEQTAYPGNRQSNITVIFTSGITVQVAFEYGALNVITALPARYKGYTGGLLGLWNDVKEDDLTTPSGQVIPHNANSSYIHYSFGEAWVIDPIESLFTYRGSLTFDDYYDPEFVPHFEEPELPPNSSLTEEEVNEACGTNFVCRFDYKTTLSRNLAVKSAETQAWSHQAVNMSAPVPVCPYLDVPYSVRIVTSYLVGGEVTLMGCVEDYTLEGPTHYTCVHQGGDTAMWEPEPSSVCKSAEEVKEEKTLMIIAIVVPICVVVLAVALGVGGYFIHKNRKKKKAKAQGIAPPKRSNNSRGHTQALDVTFVSPNLNPAGVARPPNESELVSQGVQQANTLAGSGALGSLDSFSSSQHIDTRLQSPSPDNTFDSSFGPDFTQSSAPAAYYREPTNEGYDHTRSQSETQAEIQNHFNLAVAESQEDFTSPRSQGFVPMMDNSQLSDNYHPEPTSGYHNPGYSQHDQSTHSLHQSRQNLNQSQQSLVHSRQNLSRSVHSLVQAPDLNISHAQSSHSINWLGQSQAPQYTSEHSLNQNVQAPQYASQHSIDRSYTGYVNAAMDGDAQPAQMSVYTPGASSHTEV